MYISFAKSWVHRYGGSGFRCFVPSSLDGAAVGAAEVPEATATITSRAASCALKEFLCDLTCPQQHVLHDVPRYLYRRKCRVFLYPSFLFVIYRSSLHTCMKDAFSTMPLCTRHLTQTRGASGTEVRAATSHPTADTGLQCDIHIFAPVHIARGLSDVACFPSLFEPVCFPTSISL
jgi:hypothetical protein